MRNKKTAVYIRTGIGNQRIDIQQEAAKPYLEGIDDSNIQFFCDLNVQPSSKREGYEKLLNSISKDQIDTLIVYSWDRLTRKLNENLEILDLIYAHNINVIFSSNGHRPFNHDSQNGRILEILFALFEEYEGKKITDRLKVAHRYKESLKEMQ